MLFHNLLQILSLASSRLKNGPPGSTPGYIEASKHLTSSMNLSVDPCSDFYEFTCGQWNSNNPMPSDRTSYGNFDILHDKVNQKMKDLYESSSVSSSKAIEKLRDIYRGCMDEEKINENGAKELVKSIEAIGFWPIIHGDKWQLSNFDLTDLLIQYMKEKEKSILVKFTVSPDMENPTIRRISFDQDTPWLGDREYYLDKEKYATQLTAYRTFLISTVEALASDAGMAVVRAKIEKDTDEIIEFETKLAKILVPADQRRNFSALYNLRKFDELEGMMPLIDWNRLFHTIMPETTHDYLDSNPEIMVAEIDYLNRLTSLLANTDPRVLTNYIIMRYTAGLAMQLGTKYEDINQEFFRTMYGKQEKSPRWKHCVSSTNSKMMYASGSMYVREHFDQATKNITLAMIDDLTDAFHSMLIDNDWMDDSTKQAAKEKASKILKLIGYPDFIMDDKKLDDYYKTLNISSSLSYGQMLKNHVQFGIEQQFEKLLEPVDRNEFHSNPAIVNAFYHPQQNSILFPAAILQAPFFHPSNPKALNYGAIGAVIGHEITHGFDDKGRQFDPAGNLRDWWDAETSRKYSERAECIIQQYGDIEVPGTGLNINGKLTQGENIADNGGVKEAYMAYKSYLEKNGAEPRIESLEEFDNEQMFFLGYAQVWCGQMTPEDMIDQLLSDSHSPNKYRVNVVLQNQPEFAAAFKCAAGSPMNPSNRCAVW